MPPADSSLARLSLLELIPALSPQYRSPHHLADWCGLIERAVREPIRALCSIPIRHYKTETTVHGIIWLLLQEPTLRIMFLTHSLEAAQKWGKRIRQLAEMTPVGPARGWNTIAEWRNEVGGGVVVMSADQSKIGYDCHILIIDDPIDEHGARDARVRDEVDQSIKFYTARCVRNGKPGAVLLVASRFHLDDPTGRRLARTAVEWIYIHHAAVMDEGTPDERAFAPDVWGLDELKRVRAELREDDPAELVWWNQFQNNPQPETTSTFGDPTLYTELPTWAYRVAHGVDFAYVDAPGTDFFAAVTGRIYGSKLYLLDVQRHRLDATLLESTCRAVLTKYGHARLWSYQSGPELGMSRLLIQRGIPIAILRARYNKLVRAQKTIRRWNDREILTPEQAPWRTGFVTRLQRFRGHDTDRDDEADALVSLCDGMMGSSANAAALNGRRPYPGLLG